MTETQPLTTTKPKDRRRILWLASYPKSGNTWVRHFLNCYASGFPLDINAVFQFVTGDLNPAMYQLASAIPLPELSDIEQIHYTPAVLLNHLRQTWWPYTMLKTHHAKVAINGIPLIPPDLSRRAVYVIRDPRDVVLSYADHTGHDIDTAIEAMKNENLTLTNQKSNLWHLISRWDNHVNTWTRDNGNVPYGVVKYEDLLEKPEETFRLVVNTVGLPPDEQRLKFAIEQTTFDNMRAQEEKSGFREKGKGEKFFRFGVKGKWQQSLTPQQVAKIEETFGDVMARHGYL